eukprot:SAG25_NODE_1013_length_4299_cov_1.754286_4_plen_49_part_00
MFGQAAEVQENVRHMNAAIPLDVWRKFKEAELLDGRAPTPLDAAHASL